LENLSDPLISTSLLRMFLLGLIMEEVFAGTGTVRVLEVDS
jgi:hypothetical protein